MNVDTISAKILEDARAQASAVLAEAQQKADALRVQGDAEIKRKGMESERQAKQQASELRDRMLRMAELDQKKELLAAKREVIDKAFDDALSRMQKMDIKQTKAFILKLLIQSAQGGEKLIPSTEEKEMYDSAFIQQLCDALKKEGKQGVTLSEETRRLGGGFVLKQGGLEINCAYSSVLKQARSSLEAEVAELLFAD